jgi:hypothetical protein
MRLISGKV